ncbi:MAG: ABC transporter permease [Chloroflexi bacterium]|nr:ABC transporter permease [Chloroflexota bacterium]
MGAATAAPVADASSTPRGRSLADRIWTRRNGLRVLSLVTVFLVWEIWGRANPFFASYPTAILGASGRILLPEVLPALTTTVWALLVGMAISIPIGVMFGFAMARFRLIEIALLPYMNAIYATPRIALIPVLVLWLGIGFELRVTIVALGAVFPIIINSYAGAKHVDEELLDTGRAFMASERQLLRTIVLPATTPFVFAGLRIGLGRGISGVIVAEMTAALTGIGRILISHAKYLQIAELFVGIMVLGLFSLVLFDLLNRSQRRLTPWAATDGT